MENYFVSSGYMSRDFFVLQYGQEQCSSGYGFGPCVRNNYFIHYIVSGRGIFQVGGITYELKKGMAFLIRPGQLTYYEADRDDPWYYRWIEFGGENAETILSRAGLSAENPIFTDDPEGELGTAMGELLGLGNAAEEMALSAGWRVAAAMTAGYKESKRDPGDYYIRQAVAYIQSKVHKRIFVSDVAEYVGIDRSYLGRLF
ncbi:MAG: AraC family ligand binding domain-containing protein, partial [Clostridia bacterium]